MISKSEAQEIAQAAADAALVKLFLQLDLDVNDPKEVRRLRENLNFLEAQRDGSEKIKASIKKSVVYVVSTALVGMMYLGWDIFKAGLIQLLGKGGP